MAVVYFSSNASTGAGSLVEAVANAQPGDVVRPDETVFERGSTIEIALASRLNVDKNLTLDGGPFRVRLNGGGSVGCAVVASGAVAEFTAFEFVFGQTGSGGGAQVLANASATFNRCLFAGCGASYGGAVNASAGTTVALNDCAVVGCRGVESGGGVLSSGVLTLNGVTAVGCVSGRQSDVSVYGDGVLTARNSILGVVVKPATKPTFVGSVVDVASSAVGFVASPPDDLTVETWNANAWQNWDLRLLDDMSPNPSPYRDSGDVGAMSQYDLRGNLRGRETNGAASCSPGAYETIQADLFWIGRDATGAEVETPSWFASDGWAASRFATVSGDKAPQSSDAVFIGDAIALEGATLRLKKLVVGGGASLTFDDSANDAASTASAGRFDLGVGATVARVGDKQRLQISNAILVSRFGDYCYVDALFFWNNAEALRIAPTAKFGSVVSSVKLYADGIYNSYNLQISDVASVEGDSTGCLGVYVSFQTPTARIVATGSPRIVCRSTSWAPPTGATSDFTGLADGSTPIIFAPSRSSTVAGLGSANDFVVDVSNAEIRSSPLALTLTGQTVYGAAPTGSAVALSGNAKVDERGLDVASLTMNADATLSVNGGSAKAATLTLAAGSTLTLDGASVNVAELTVADGATVAFSGVDAVLTATAAATVGAATFTGTGYFATPQGTDVSAATFAETVRACDCGASLTSFLAAPGVTGAALAWTVENAEVSVLLERQNANGWAVVETRAVGGSARVDGLEPGTTLFRAFDGAQFLTAQTLVQASHIRLDYDDSSVVALAPVYEVVLEIVLMSDYRNRGESPLLLARVADSATGDFIPKDAVASIVYSARRVETLYGSKRYVDVEGHVDREIPLDAYFALPVVDDPRWLASRPNDDRGYNFRFEPDSTRFPVLPEPGDYEIVVEIRFRQGNPAPLVFRTRVV